MPKQVSFKVLPEVIANTPRKPIQKPSRALVQKLNKVYSRPQTPVTPSPQPMSSFECMEYLLRQRSPSALDFHRAGWRPSNPMTSRHMSQRKSARPKSPKIKVSSESVALNGENKVESPYGRYESPVDTVSSVSLPKSPTSEMSKQQMGLDSPERKRSLHWSGDSVVSSRSDIHQGQINQENQVRSVKGLEFWKRGIIKSKTPLNEEHYKRSQSARQSVNSRASVSVSKSKHNCEGVEELQRSQKSNLFIQKEAYPERWIHRKLEHEHSKIKSIMKKPKSAGAAKVAKVNKGVHDFQKKARKKRSKTAKELSLAGKESIKDQKQRSHSAELPSEKTVEPETDKEPDNTFGIENKLEDHSEEDHSLEALIEKYNLQMERVRTLTCGIGTENKVTESLSDIALVKEDQRRTDAYTELGQDNKVADVRGKTDVSLPTTSNGNMEISGNKIEEEDNKHHVPKKSEPCNSTLETIESESEDGTEDIGNKSLFTSDLESIKKVLKNSERQEVEMEKQAEKSLMANVKNAADKFKKVVEINEGETSEPRKADYIRRTSRMLRNIKEFKRQILATKGIVLSETEEESDSSSVRYNLNCCIAFVLLTALFFFKSFVLCFPELPV